MGASENKQLMQRIFDELAKGSGDLFIGSMADDVRWTVTGTTEWSRTYAGKQTVLNELIGPLFARISGPLLTIASRFIAEGDFVVVEARGSSTLHSGVPYNNRYCFVFRVADSQVKEVTEYMDTDLARRVLIAEPA